MKKLLCLALLCSALTALGQPVIESSAPYRGDYVGVVLPVGKCDNERHVIIIDVGRDGTLDGEIWRYDNVLIQTFSARWPFFSNGKFTSNITGLGFTVKGSFNSKTGSGKGSIVTPDGCRYTYTVHRRYAVPVD